MKTNSSTKHLVLAAVCFVICLLLLLAIRTNANANALVDEFDGNTYTPQTTYGFKDVPFSTANKWWFAAFIASQGLDIWSTQYGLDNGYEEFNPLYGDDPTVWSMLLVKALLIIPVYAGVEYLSSAQTLQSNRSLWYGSLALTTTGVSIYNFILVDSE